MITFVAENLFALYLNFMVLLSAGLLEGIRRLIRRDRMARGVRP